MTPSPDLHAGSSWRCPRRVLIVGMSTILVVAGLGSGFAGFTTSVAAPTIARSSATPTVAVAAAPPPTVVVDDSLEGDVWGTTPATKVLSGTPTPPPTTNCGAGYLLSVTNNSDIVLGETIAASAGPQSFRAIDFYSSRYNGILPGGSALICASLTRLGQSVTVSYDVGAGRVRVDNIEWLLAKAFGVDSKLGLGTTAITFFQRVAQIPQVVAMATCLSGDAVSAAVCLPLRTFDLLSDPSALKQLWEAAYAAGSNAPIVSDLVNLWNIELKVSSDLAQLVHLRPLSKRWLALSAQIAELKFQERVAIATLVPGLVGQAASVAVFTAHFVGQDLTSPAGSIAFTLGIPVPENTTPPTITDQESHSPPVIGDTLAATVGTWTNSPSSYTYTWYSCSTATHCAQGPNDSASYAVTASDLGNSIRVAVAARNEGGLSKAASSAPTGIVVVSQLPIVQLISADGSGNAVDAQGFSISANGRYVALNNGMFKDRATGSLIRFDPLSVVTAPDTNICCAAVANDGTVVFVSIEAGLVPGYGTPGQLNAYVYSPSSQAVTPLLPSALAASPSGSQLTVTPDGRYVLFTSASSGLPGANGHLQTYRWDRTTASLVLVSATSSGDAATLDAFPAGEGGQAMSDDAHLVLFTSGAPNLAGTTPLDPPYPLLYLKNLDTGSLQILSQGSFIETTGSTPTPIRYSQAAVISGDGRTVVYQGGDQSTYEALMKVDLATGAQDVLLRLPDGSPLYAAGDEQVSTDGSYVAFASFLALTPGVTQTGNYYQYVTRAGAFTEVSRGADGMPQATGCCGNGTARTMTEDGRTVMYNLGSAYVYGPPYGS